MAGRATTPIPQLRLWRVKRALTQEQLAQKAGVAVSTIHLAEKKGGTVTVVTLQKLAEALNCDPQQLTSDGSPIAA